MFTQRLKQVMLTCNGGSGCLISILVLVLPFPAISPDVVKVSDAIKQITTRQFYHNRRIGWKGTNKNKDTRETLLV